MARRRFRTSSRRPLGIGGKVALTLFLSVFFAGGAFFFYLLSNELLEAGNTYLWKAMPCEIQESAVLEEPSNELPFLVQVRYSYLWEEQTFTSSQPTLKQARYSDYQKAQRLVDRYPAGAQATCYVNPANPAQALLFRPGLWVGLFLVIPLVFMLVGGGGIYLAWFGKINEGSESDAISAAGMKSKKPISEHAKGANAQGCLVLFFLLFFLVGLGFFYGFFLRPVFKIMSAGDWVETPCLVESSKVRSHRGDDSTTYSVDILYSYTYQDREYKSNQYHFMGGSSSGRKGKAAIVRRHPPGTETVCYVNPKDPTEAVLERGFTPDLWFGLIPLVFVIVGAGGILFALKSSRMKKLRDRGQASISAQGRRSRGAKHAAPVVGTDGPLVLKAKSSPWAKVIGIIFVAAFWNGIVSVFVWQVIKAWQQGRGSWMEKWFLPIFLIPFVLIGLVLIGAIFYYLLALFNPRIRLTVSTGRITPGRSLELEWHIQGRVHVLRRLHILLEGREEATYTRGTRSYTDKNVFATLDLANTASRSDFRHGRAKVSIPEETVPSFEAPHNKILWIIRVKGEINRWPDVLEEFPLQVLPLKAQSAPSQ